MIADEAGLLQHAMSSVLNEKAAKSFTEAVNKLKS